MKESKRLKNYLKSKLNNMVIIVHPVKECKSSLKYFGNCSEQTIQTEYSYSSFGESQIPEQIQHFNQLASLCQKETVKSKFLHVVLSLHPEEDIDKTKMMCLYRISMKKLFGDDLDYVAYLHRKKDSSMHIHGLLARVRSDTSIISTQHLWIKAAKVSREIEIEFGLRITESKPPAKKMTHQIVHAITYGYDTIKSQIWESLDQALRLATSLDEYVQCSAEFGIDVQFRPNKMKPSGVSYSVDIDLPLKQFDEAKSNSSVNAQSKFVVRGKRLGNAYMVESIKNQCLKNAEERDATLINQKRELLLKVERLIDISENFNQLIQNLSIGKIDIKSDNKKDFHFQLNEIKILGDDLSIIALRKFMQLLETEKKKSKDSSISKEKSLQSKSIQRINDNELNLSI